MADELGPYSVLRVEVGLERQQTQHEIAGASDRAHPSLPPGPNLWAHVLHRLQARPLEALFESQVEVGHVDADEYIRPRSLESLYE